MPCIFYHYTRKESVRASDQLQAEYRGGELAPGFVIGRKRSEVAGDAVFFPIAMAGGLGTRRSALFWGKLLQMPRFAARFGFGKRALGRFGDSPAAGFVLAFARAHAAYMRSLGCASKGRWRKANNQS